MKINESTSSRPVDAASGASEAKAPRPVDRVSVEDQARIRAVAQEAQELMALERAERLSDLKAQISAGTYRPDADRIAHEILRDAELRAKLATILG